MVIRQGDIYWVELEVPSGSEPGYRHPHVVVQNDLLNQSRIRTVIVCQLTSNLKRAELPGNILLNKKETNLSKDSVANVTQLLTVDKTRLEEYVGTLSRWRVLEILDGIRLILEPR
ncbi:MAG: type II toxin-antitoxin system PemK/MazF family toxin [Chloroflexi bacterium]|nr:type II toxin-antitoxin system PemK/MazF family toxin [Chloroflexota bacterium]